MSGYASTKDLAKRIWARHPVRLGLTIALGVIGLDAIAVDLGLWQPNLLIRYVGASAGASAGFALGRAWQIDADERARRVAEAAEAQG